MANSLSTGPPIEKHCKYRMYPNPFYIKVLLGDESKSYTGQYAFTTITH